jgi:hypothetical protein
VKLIVAAGHAPSPSIIAMSVLARTILEMVAGAATAEAQERMQAASRARMGLVSCDHDQSPE